MGGWLGGWGCNTFGAQQQLTPVSVCVSDGARALERAS